MPRRKRWTSVRAMPLFPNNGPIRHEDVYPRSRPGGCGAIVRQGKAGERACRMPPVPGSDYCAYHTGVVAADEHTRLSQEIELMDTHQRACTRCGKPSGKYLTCRECWEERR